MLVKLTIAVRSEPIHENYKDVDPKQLLQLLLAGDLIETTVIAASENVS